MRATQFITRHVIPPHFVTAYCWFRFRSFVSPRAEVEISANLKLGRKSAIGSFTKIKSSSATLTIGNRVTISNGCFMNSFGPGLEIGDHSMIGPNTCIIMGRYCYDELNVPMQDQGLVSNGSIRIGRDVWIGACCTITDGADIGDGSIVSANSAVSTRIPPYSIVSGNPAKVVFTRR